MLKHPAQPLAIDLDPASSDQREPIRLGKQLLDLSGGQRLAVKRHLHAEVEERVLAQPGRRFFPDRGRYLRARRAVCPPRRGHSHHDAGALQLWNITEKTESIVGLPAQRMEDLTRVDHGFQPRTDFGRALNGEEQRQQALLVRRACVFA